VCPRPWLVPILVLSAAACGSPVIVEPGAPPTLATPTTASSTPADAVTEDDHERTFEVPEGRRVSFVFGGGWELVESTTRIGPPRLSDLRADETVFSWGTTALAEGSRHTHVFGHGEETVAVTFEITPRQRPR